MIEGLTLTHLRMLEAESIHIMREVAAEFARPVMLYSIGKDSSVHGPAGAEGLLARAGFRSRCCMWTPPTNSAR